jgi:hypothetical protein
MNLKSRLGRIGAILSVASILSLAVSCTPKDDRSAPDTGAIAGRQLVVEQFGPDVWESTTNYNTFIARSPDNSVWLVVIQRAYPGDRWTSATPTRIATKTMIFNGTVPLPAEGP